MQELIICRGLPASGKSTWAKAWVLEDAKNRIRVNRDDIRRMLGPYWVPSREKLVTLYESLAVEHGLKEGYSVIIDATNLRSIDRFLHIINHLTYSNIIVPIVIKSFIDISVEECIKRDLQRPKEEQVGEAVIRRMAKFI